jgi:peptidoglycan/LPS O-acetylase OafA/YrhL
MTEPETTLRRRNFRESFSHFLVGFAILAKGWAKLEEHPGLSAEIILIFLAGIFIILGTVFLRRLEEKIRNFTATFHVAEGLALLFVGSIFLREAGSRLQYFYFFIGAAFLAVGLVFFFCPAEKREKAQFQVQIWLGIAFMAAGIFTFVMNRFGETSPWADVVALVFVAVGLAMIVRTRLKKKSGILRR